MGKEEGAERGDLDWSEEQFTLEGRFSTKEGRVGAVDVASLPRSFRENSRKEVLALEYVRNFEEQFVELFPERPRLLLCPKNECGVKKFVCTTIRPTKLPYRPLYNAASAAEFFSHFVQYEPLKNPTKVPDVLPSPSYTLQEQLGDCFDLSVLLCSVLIGAGYDAYCVSGYAPRQITLLDRTRELCRSLDALPQNLDDVTGEIENLKDDFEEQRALNHWEDEAEKEKLEKSKFATNKSKDESKLESSETEGEIVQSSTEDQIGDDQKVETVEMEQNKDVEQQGDSSFDPYSIEVIRKRESEYLASVEYDRNARIEMKEGGDEKVLLSLNDDEDSDLMDASDDEVNDEFNGRRVHSWVLVKAGMRQVKANFLIEPTTGKLYRTGEWCPYLAVESVWNDRNYWVNMVPNARFEDIRYEFQSKEKWENVFIDKDEDAIEELYAEPSDIVSFGKSTFAGTVGETDLETSESKQTVPVDDKEEGKQNDEIKEKEAILDMPPSWVKKLCIPKEAYKRKYNNNGQRTQLFLRSKLESFAEFVHSEGLVRQLVVYKDKFRISPIEIQEQFANRQDKLFRRTKFPLESRMIESFKEGHLGGLETSTEVAGKSRELKFFPNSRLDGLVCRKEVHGRLITEAFEGRQDRLMSRMIELEEIVGEETDSAGYGHAFAFKHARSVMTMPKNPMRSSTVRISSMVEKFDRDSSKDADYDVEERIFDIANGEISVKYHFPKGRIKRSSRIFFKDPSKEPIIVQSYTFAKALSGSAIEIEFQESIQAEKACYQSVRETEREVHDILSSRKREESTVVLNQSIFDTAQERARQAAAIEAAEKSREDQDPRQVEYLTPFLQKYSSPDKLSKEEATSARDTCLKSLKERLLERANIIQSRLDEENAQLAKKQAAFQRGRDHVEGADQEFERFCSEAMFRIQILEQRLARHEESALSVYANMDQRLRNDPRLAILHGR